MQLIPLTGTITFPGVVYYNHNEGMQLIPLTGTITYLDLKRSALKAMQLIPLTGTITKNGRILRPPGLDAAHTPHGDDNLLNSNSLYSRGIRCNSYPSRGRNKTRDGKLLLSIPCFHLLGKINLRPSGLEYLPRQRLFPDPSCRSPPLLLLCRIYCTKQLYPAFFIAFCLLSSG